MVYLLCGLRGLRSICQSLFCDYLGGSSICSVRFSQGGIYIVLIQVLRIFMCSDRYKNSSLFLAGCSTCFLVSRCGISHQ